MVKLTFYSSISSWPYYYPYDPYYYPYYLSQQKSVNNTSSGTSPNQTWPYWWCSPKQSIGNTNTQGITQYSSIYPYYPYYPYWYCDKHKQSSNVESSKNPNETCGRRHRHPYWCCAKQESTENNSIQDFLSLNTEEQYKHKHSFVYSSFNTPIVNSQTVVFSSATVLGTNIIINEDSIILLCPGNYLITFNVSSSATSLNFNYIVDTQTPVAFMSNNGNIEYSFLVQSTVNNSIVKIMNMSGFDINVQGGFLIVEQK